ncbi:MAG: hypothetical protein KDE56_23510 [Anaerolineales bacterium]|nr:hypothetical protein [Anaerolineales bacterium]
MFPALPVGRKTAVIATIITLAVLGFELFNFDTTRFALATIMRGRTFAGLSWATVLALAFCSLDLAGLVRVFTIEPTAKQTSLELWLMTAAWLLGATLNAAMTWYAMALLIAPLGADIGAALFTHAQMLRAAPLLIATLVWLTRILLISSVTLTLERFMHAQESRVTPPRPPHQIMPQRPRVSENGHVPH